MSETQQTAYEKALARAHQNGLQIAGRGFVKATNERMYAVTSASEAARWHVVRVAGPRLVCDCTAATFHPERICAHRALVHEQLQREASEAQAAIDAVAELQRETRRLAEQTARERETAPLARDNRAFSIWKS